MHHSLRRGFYSNDRSHFAAAVELQNLDLLEDNFSGNGSVDRPVLGNVHVRTWSVPKTFLTNEDFSSIHSFASEALHASAL